MKNPPSAFLKRAQIVVLIICALSIMSMIPDVHAGQSENEIDVEVTFNDSEFHINDTIEAEITLTNNDEEDMVITFDDGCLFTIRVSSTTLIDDSYVTYAESKDPCDSDDDDETLTLGLGDSETYDVELDLDDEDIAYGTYNLIIETDAISKGDNFGLTETLDSFSEEVLIYQDIKLSVETQAQFYQNEEIVGFYTIDNQDKDDYDYTRECSYGPTYKIYLEEIGSSSDELVYEEDYDFEKSECDEETTREISAGSDYDDEVVFYDPDEYDELETGDYTLEIELDDGTTAETTFEVIAYDQDYEFELSVTLDDYVFAYDDSEQKVLLTWSIENEGNSTHDIQLSTCNPNVYVYRELGEDDNLVYRQSNIDCDDTADFELEASESYVTTTFFDLEELASVWGDGDYYVSVVLENEEGEDIARGDSPTFEIKPEIGPTFDDVDGHWGEPYIQDLAEQGVVSGYSDDQFYPDRSITRAEFTKIVMEGLDVSIYDEDEMSVRSFSDVDTSDWFFTYVETAYRKGLVSGYDGAFKPNQTITRAEAMSVLVQVYFVGEDTLEYWLEDLTISSFEDVTTEWQIPYIQFAFVELGIISGYKDAAGDATGVFGPNDELTRAEASKLISTFP